ncbi:Peptidase family M48 [Noviherbaspirillum humi]|uniref:Peptidase family M48 n=1 Tax=Noviherbaspirillum humi TaxID=1688639 RepID=A0A239CCF9_9BURK|nr:M48 family metallopeptidase [Noviherbaspirillum humi]SNS17134.1 Peptidase family M48 [Noviherbaspirillum humi]
MKKKLAAAWLGLLLCATPPALLAKDNARGAEDGVRVDEMSPLRNMVPEEELEAAAAQQYNELKQEAAKAQALAPPDHPQTQRLRAIAQRLIAQAPRWNQRAAQWNWEISLIGSKQVNAFCMPGGKIAFFSGLINNLKLTDDEVAVVMGHEMAHALREHSRERVAKSGLADAGAKIAGLGLSAIFGIDPNLTSAATGGVANLAMLKFSRNDETEADLVGLDIMARAGFDPRAGIALWQKMGMLEKSAPPQWLSTHPAGPARLAEIDKHLPSVMPLYAKAKGVAITSLPPYQTNVSGIPPVR